MNFLELRSLKLKNPILAIGLMSGTSIDAVDSVLVEFSSSNELKIKVICYLENPIKKETREKLEKAMNIKESNVQLLCQLNREIAILFAESVELLLKKSNISREQVSFIASHGQTVYHIPPNNKEELLSSTLQIGDGCTISQMTSITTISDFRVRDMAEGGEGAPLIPFIDAFLFYKNNEETLLQNIGGISNCTLLSPKGIIAFDNGPGNAVIDFLMHKMFNKNLDENGEIASKGKIIEDLLEERLKNPYFALKPPKSTGRELFGSKFAEEFYEEAKEKYKASDQDIITTATELTARSIAESYKQFLSHSKIKNVIVSGGGSKNSFLIKRIQEISNFKISNIDSFDLQKTGITTGNKEAMGFALLGLATMVGITSNITSCTNAKENVILGKISPTKSFYSFHNKLEH